MIETARCWSPQRSTGGSLETRSYTRYSALVMGLLLFLDATAGTNQWSVQGPFGGLVVDLVYRPGDSSTVYAATRAVVYRSTDGGLNWSAMRENFGRTALTDLEVDPANPQVLYVAERGAGIYRSSDRGVTFTLIRPVTVNADTDGPSALAVSADGATLYYASASGRTFRSTDSGTTWNARTQWNNGAGPVALAINPGNSAVVYGARNGALFRSADGGGVWTPMPLPPGSSTQFGGLLVSAGSVTYADANGVHVTTTDGASWETSFVGPGGPLARNPADPTMIVVAQPGGELQRFVGGSWTIARGRFQRTGAQLTSRLVISPDGQRLLVANGVGVQFTENMGDAYGVSTNGIAASVFSMVAGAGGVYATTESGTLDFATGEGLWQGAAVPINPVDAGERTLFSAVAAHPTNAQRLLVGNPGANVFRSSNGGSSWSPSTGSTPLTIPRRFAFDPVDPTVVYLAVDGQTSVPTPDVYVHRSTDGGATFAPASGNLFFPNVQALLVDPNDRQRLFLGSANAPNGPNGVFRSIDSGTSWSAISPTWQGFDIAIDPVTERIYVAAGSEGLQSSDNSGDTWVPITSFSGFGAPLQVEVDSNTRSVYVVGVDVAPNPDVYYVMRSVDRGQTWQRIPNRFDDGWVPTELALHPSTPGLVFLAVQNRGPHTLQIRPDVEVSIQGHSGSRTVGTASSFDIVVHNAEQFAATGVEVEATLPAGIQSVTVRIGTTSCPITAGVARCELGALDGDESVTIDVDYTPSAAGSLAVQATASSNEQDRVPANNSASATAAAAAATPPPNPPSSGGGGGGTLGWLLLSSLVIALRSRRIGT